MPGNNIIIKSHYDWAAEGIDNERLIEDVKELYRRNLRAAAIPYIDDFTDRFEEYLEEETRKGTLFVAYDRDEDRAAGFALLVYPDKPPARDANIKQLAVETEYRRQGIASALFDAAEDYVMECYPDCAEITTNTWATPELNMGTFNIATGRGYMPKLVPGVMKNGQDRVDFARPVSFFINPASDEAQDYTDKARSIGEAVRKGESLHDILRRDARPGPSAGPSL